MSDQSQGDGWWMASDGKWYPPHLHPDYVAPAPPPPVQPTAPPPQAASHQQWAPQQPSPQQWAPQQSVPSAMRSPKELKADAAAAKARAKAARPWFKKKRIMISLVLVAIIAVSVAAGGGSDDKDTKTVSVGGTTAPASEHEQNSREDDIFPNRPDEKDGDKERNVGEAADLSGYTATVTAAQRQQTINDNQFQNDGYLVAHVEIRNRDSSAQAFNKYDWKLITPAGTIIDPCICLGDDELGSGDLASGGTTSGSIVWEVGATKGDYYVVYDPDLFGSDNRGIWKVTVS